MVELNLTGGFLEDENSLQQFLRELVRDFFEDELRCFTVLELDAYWCKQQPWHAEDVGYPNLLVRLAVKSNMGCNLLIQQTKKGFRLWGYSNQSDLYASGPGWKGSPADDPQDVQKWVKQLPNDLDDLVI